jgi:hypothetical protein
MGFLSCKNQHADQKKENCIVNLNILMDSWHQAAAVADEDVFFGFLDSNAVYLGTDPGERWLKHEFMDWGLKYFQRDTAWVFVPYNRIWSFSEDFQYAWFDELLETHMGICRGSGVLKMDQNKWKIQQYNLALTLPNDKMNGFRELQNVPLK